METQAEDDFVSELLDQQQDMHRRAVRIIGKKNQMIKQQSRLIVWLINQLKQKPYKIKSTEATASLRAGK